VTDAGVIGPTIVAVGALAGTVWNARRSRLDRDGLEALKAELGEQKAEADARRAYEYEARKRTYEIYEPLRIQLLDAIGSALRQMTDILIPPPHRQTSASSDGYVVKATTYYLLSPIVLCRMVERRLTLVDLALDRQVHVEYALAQAVYHTLADDAFIARLAPELPYTPYVQGWRERRAICPQQFRRQGLPPGRCDTALDSLHITRAEGVDTLMSFGEFERVFDGVISTDVKSGPGAARDLFDDFAPATRPVLWRIMVIQSLLYWCIQQAVWDGQLPAPDHVAGTFAQSSVFRDLSARVESYGHGAPAESFDTTARVAADYFASRVAPSLERVDRLGRASTERSTQRRDEPA
jgi:hypothetical protein